MKNRTPLYTVLLLSVISLFWSCDNTFETTHTAKPGDETGRVLILLNGEPPNARTLLPENLDEADYIRYDLVFSADGRDPILVNNWIKNTQIILPVGSWRLDITASISDGAESYTSAARGNNTLTVSNGGTTNVSVVLSSIANEGNGAFTWNFSYPEDVQELSITIEPYSAGSSQTIYLESSNHTTTANPGSMTLAAGYYRIFISLDNGVRQTGKREVMHIYKEHTTTMGTDEAPYAFTAADFAVLRVTNTNNAGTGSLRQALADATSGNTILVDLEPGSVINLQSRLEISTAKTLTIEGNGVTLSGSGITPGASSQILYISNSSANITVRRIHFTNGKATSNGGAIYKYAGNLTLESCILSGNSTTAASGGGGAIYSAGTQTLTVIGCTFYGNTTTYMGGAIYTSAGTLTLTGNIFWGNTATNGGNVVYRSGGTVSSGGYNVSDRADGTDTAGGSGFTFAAGDVQPAVIPITPVSFKPLVGSAAINKVSTKPAGYPAFDFYGELISAAPVAAGAVQTPAVGYYIGYHPLGNGTISLGSGTVDADGMAASGSSVTLNAEPVSGFVLAYWEVNGIRQSQQAVPTQLVLTMNGHKDVRAIFGKLVSTSSNTGAGSLREALTNAQNYELIIIDPLLSGQTISLTSRLSINTTKTLVIEGNGIILLGSGITPGASSQILYTSNSSGNITIRRIHFKNGKATNNGGAIYNSAGVLKLESCILSGNSTTAASEGGGAIYNAGTLTVTGCTFYGNTSGAYGGAIYNTSGTLTVTGNIFRENVAAASYNIVYQGGTVSSGNYNILDTTDNGFTLASGDVRTSALPINSVSFKPLQGRHAIGNVISKPADYPAYDFYGEPIGNAPLNSGAVQTQAAGYYLNYSPWGNETLIVSSGTVDADGMTTSSSVTLNVEPESGFGLAYWSVNGSRQPAGPLVLTMDGHKDIRAVFGRLVSNTNDSGPGSFRDALSTAQNSELIIFAPSVSGQTINLQSRLSITTTGNLTIEGDGITLLGSAIPDGDNSQILYVSSPNVTIRRVHFKDGKTTTYDSGGAAIYKNMGVLTLESCIFSGNSVTTSSSGGGGAINNRSGTLNVTGCTFYRNISSTYGGAIYNAGTLALKGNIFWGNRNNGNGGFHVVYPNGTQNSGGFNVSDQPSWYEQNNPLIGSGFYFTSGDVQTPVIPINPVSLRPLTGRLAIGRVNPKPYDYPSYDFYGTTISAPAAAGAMQTPAVGWYLDYGPSGNGTISVISGTVDAEGMTAGGSVTLNAVPESGFGLAFWEVNGIRQPQQTNPTQLVFAMNDNKEVRGVFGRLVINTNDSGPGSFREALNTPQNSRYVIFDPSLSGETINLESRLQIGSTRIIEGNGITLSGSGITPVSDESQILYIGSNYVITIRRIHFKDGTANTRGGAINNWVGNLILESCIFSGNRTTSATAYGGAIYNGNNLTVTGCTFYNNTTAYRGGAIYSSSLTGILTLTGNIFWGNTATNSGNVVYSAEGTVTSGNYNVSDKASGTDAALGSGFTFKSGDRQASVVPITPVSFRLLSGSAAISKVSSKPTDYPAYDFYGTAIGSDPVAAGAVQTQAAGTGYYLDCRPSGNGTINVPGVNTDGMASGSVTLTAVPGSGFGFAYWEVNGIRQPQQAVPTQLTLTMNGHKDVQAIFGKLVSTSSNAGAGSLREALENAQNYEHIVFAAGISQINLTSRLEIDTGTSTRPLTIEGGNGVILLGSGITPVSNGSQILSSSSANVTIRRIHFKDGKATGRGGAVTNALGNLTLESCIFSGNSTTLSTSTSSGGAIFNSGTLTVNGCTFYGNTSGYRGGVIGNEYYSTIILKGNIFWGNTGNSGDNVVYIVGNGTVSSGGYNVSDKASGTDAALGSGFTFTPTDVQLSIIPINTTNFRPLSAELNNLRQVPVNLENFPATDFYGNDRWIGSWVSGGYTPSGAISAP
ncbi:hypothetical protein AGMMS50293_04270 [Spirochaetia bacterium]|nr:hypothetical protein AGMMS50293_04270 [Spirochaetia bacterium]